MKKNIVLVLALALASLATLSAAAEPVFPPEATAPEVTQAAPPLALDSWLPPPAAMTCQIFSCSEVVPCPCENPLIIVGEVCEDQEGRLWELGRCNPTDRHCQSTNLTTCT